MPPPASSSLFYAVAVVELPALRPLSHYPPPPPPPQLPPGKRAKVQYGPYLPQQSRPTFVTLYPTDVELAPELRAAILEFCFPDLDHLLRSPYSYEHVSDEYVFVAEQKVAPFHVHGFCRRYRIGGADTAFRLDLSPSTAAGEGSSSSSSSSSSSGSGTAAPPSPSFQCICILSEQPYHRLFSQVLQLLHAARLAGGFSANRLMGTLLSFNTALPGSIVPLRSLISRSEIPGYLNFPRERLRVPPALGLAYTDVPLAPLLSRLDAPALMALFSGLLCERRVVMVAQNLATISSCVHAARAMLAPLEWSYLFYPILMMAHVQFAGAPTPFLMGMTPAQFLEFQRLELHASQPIKTGEILLVALDEGYVAVLNGSEPLIDFDGPTPANGNTGEVRYCGPRCTPEGEAARFAGPASGASEAAAAAAAAAADTSNFALNQATLTVGRRDVLMAALAARALDVVARGGSSSSAGGAVASPSGKAAAAAAAAAAAGAGGSSEAADISYNSSAVEAALSPYHSHSSTHAYLDGVVIARTARNLYTQRRVQDRRHSKREIAEVFSAPPPGAAEGSGSSRVAAGASGAAVEQQQQQQQQQQFSDSFFAHEESGTVNLSVDLHALSSQDPVCGGPARRRAPPAPTAGYSKWWASALSAFGTRDGKEAAPLTNADCPAARLAFEVRGVYARERREGAFDEVHLRACFLAFAAAVFGRASEYVSCSDREAREVREGRLAQERLALAFNKERWLESSRQRGGASAASPTCAKLCRIVANSLLLTTFACNVFLGSPRAPLGPKEAALAEERKRSGAAQPVNLLNTALQEAAAWGGGSSGGAGASSSAASGSSSSSSSSSSCSGNFGQLAVRLSGLIHRYDVFPSLADLEPLPKDFSISWALSNLDAASCSPATVPIKPNDPAPPPFAYVVTALRGMLLAATDAMGPPPLRPLLLDPSPRDVVRLAAAATHDPHLLNVVIGTLILRLNEGSKHWQHTYRALLLLRELILRGSPRVMPLAMSLVPLLRFLMHPTRSLAVRAGYVSEDLGGQAESAAYIQAANAAGVRTGPKKGASPPPGLPGLLYSRPGMPLPPDLATRRGKELIARHAARCYLLLSCPRRWLVERCLASGLVGLHNAAPLLHPLPYPGITLDSLAAAGTAALPPGWLPSYDKPFMPRVSQGAARDVRGEEDVLVEGGAGVSARPLSSDVCAVTLAGAAAFPPHPPIAPQLRAALVVWDTVHKVAAPTMASSTSLAMAELLEREVSQVAAAAEEMRGRHDRELAQASAMAAAAAAAAAAVAAAEEAAAASSRGNSRGKQPQQQPQQPQQPLLGNQRATSLRAALHLPRQNYGGVGVAPMQSFTSPPRKQPSAAAASASAMPAPALDDAFTAFDQKTLSSVFGAPTSAAQPPRAAAVQQQQQQQPALTAVDPALFDLIPAKQPRRENDVDPFGLGAIISTPAVVAPAAKQQQQQQQQQPAADPFAASSSAKLAAATAQAAPPAAAKVSSASLLDDWMSSGSSSSSSSSSSGVSAAVQHSRRPSAGAAATAAVAAAPAPAALAPTPAAAAASSQPRSRANSRPSLSSVFAPLTEKGVATAVAAAAAPGEAAGQQPPQAAPPAAAATGGLAGGTPSASASSAELFSLSQTIAEGSEGSSGSSSESSASLASTVQSSPSSLEPPTTPTPPAPVAAAVAAAAAVVAAAPVTVSVAVAPVAVAVAVAPVAVAAAPLSPGAFDFDLPPSDFDFSPASVGGGGETASAIEAELQALAFAGFDVPSPLGRHK